MAHPTKHRKRNSIDPSIDAPITSAELCPGAGKDAWRFLARLAEPAAYLRASPLDRYGVPTQICEVGAIRGDAWRVLLHAPAASAAEWLTKGWIAPRRQVPGVVVYYAITKEGRRLARAGRPRDGEQPPRRRRPAAHRTLLDPRVIAERRQRARARLIWGQL